MFCRVAITLLLLQICSIVAQDNATETEGPCPCLFDGADADDCVVFGSFAGELKGWPLASQECLSSYQIKIDAPDPSLLCSSANSFVNGLKNGPLSSSTVKFGLGIPYGGFWEESTTNPDIPVLKDTITIDGTTFDCEASESNCYNAMKLYFSDDEAGKDEMADVCNQLENQARNALEAQQSVLRTRLCLEFRDDADITSECVEIFDEMNDLLVDNPTTTCGGFGTGPGNMELPECGATSLAASIRRLRLVSASTMVSISYGLLITFI